MRLDIAYRLHFTYSAPVAESQNEVRVRPLDDVRQQVLSYRLTTTPATRVLQTRDYFGTTVDHLGIRSPHDDLLVVAEASVETATTAAAHVPVTGERLREQTFINQHFEYLTPSQHVQWGDLVDEVASWAVRDAADDVYEQVLAVVRAVPTVLSYRRGSTAIGVTLEELIDGGAGVCQDFAHLAVGMLRCIGVPARYVLGIPVRLGRDPARRRITRHRTTRRATCRRTTRRRTCARAANERPPVQAATLEPSLAQLSGTSRRLDVQSLPTRRQSRCRRMPGSRLPCPDPDGLGWTRRTADRSASGMW